MTVRSGIKAIRKSWTACLLILLVAFGATIALSALTSPVYVATSRVFVSVRLDPGRTDQLVQGGTFSTERVKSYASLVSSPMVLAPVVSTLRLPETVEQLAPSISADAPTDTVLIDISVRNEDGEAAASISNAVAESLVRSVVILEGQGDPRNSLVSATVVAPAAPANSALWPNWPVNLAVGLLVGLAAALSYALIRERFDRSVKSQDELQQSLQRGVLATISRSSLDQGECPARDHPRSSVAEEFRLARTAIQFSSVGGPLKLVEITSAHASEGKSFFVANLAITYAQQGISVCVVDADLRRPTLHTYFGASNDVGLSSAVVGQVDNSTAIQKVGNGVHLMASGPLPPNPAELVGSERARELFNWLSVQFDVVLVDSPPLLAVTDATVMAEHMNGLILVVRAGITSREDVSAARERVLAAGVKILGGVLNLAESKASSPYYYSYSASDSRSPRDAGMPSPTVKANDMPSPVPRSTVLSDAETRQLKRGGLR